MEFLYGICIVILMIVGIIVLIIKDENNMFRKDKMLEIFQEKILSKDEKEVTIRMKIFYQFKNYLKHTKCEEEKQQLKSKWNEELINVVKNIEIRKIADWEEVILTNWKKQIEQETAEKNVKVGKVEILQLNINGEERKNNEDKNEIWDLESLKEEEENSINKDIEEWCQCLKKFWKNQQSEKMVGLFTDNVKFTLEENTLEVLDEIEAVWERIFEEDVRKLEYKLLTIDENIFTAEFKAEGTKKQKIVFEAELDETGICKYFKLWETIIED